MIKPLNKKPFKCLNCSWFKQKLRGRKSCSLNLSPNTCGREPETDFIDDLAFNDGVDSPWKI